MGCQRAPLVSWWSMGRALSVRHWRRSRGVINYPRIVVLVQYHRYAAMTNFQRRMVGFAMQSADLVMLVWDLSVGKGAGMAIQMMALCAEEMTATLKTAMATVLASYLRNVTMMRRRMEVCATPNAGMDILVSVLFVGRHVVKSGKTLARFV